MKRLVTLILPLAVAIVVVAPETADAEVRVGLRGGLAVDPEAIFGGATIGFSPGSLPDLRVEASGELGIGLDEPDFFMIRFPIHVKYLFPITGNIELFPLGGLEISYFNLEDPFGSTTEVALNLGGGLEFGNFGFQLYFATPDVPDVDFVFYYLF